MEKVSRTLRQIAGFMPSTLPRTSQDLEVFVVDIFKTYDLPDMPSYRQAVAAQILHLPVLCTRKPKRFFAKSIRKAQANEIAYNMIQGLKEQAKNEQGTAPATA